MKIKQKNKRAQEEIVGFVLVVVLVAVVFLILLGIFVRKDSTTTEKESIDVSQFLDSIVEYATDCKIYSDSIFLDFGDLIKACYDNENCENLNKGACDVLKRTSEILIEKSWKISSDGFYKGYVFNSSYSSISGAENSEILFISNGNCSSGKIGSEKILPASYGFGTITNSLIICT